MKDASEANAWRTTLKKRLVWTGMAFALWATAIEARLVFLQVYQHDEQVARAATQRSRTIPLPGRRGAIVDRHGLGLARTVSADSVFAVPSEIANPEAVVARLCEILTDCSPAERREFVQKIRQNAKNTKKQFLYLRRLITPAETGRILDVLARDRQRKKGQAAALQGINLVRESRRVYPNRELAAHVLGFVGTENRGLGGIEAAYDSKIRGRDGTLLVEVDARENAFGRVETPPTAGRTVELTIDATIQHIAERELRAVITEHHAVAGTVVVMDPRTGEILALANEPTFNPNAYARVAEDVRRNRGVQEIYEPGSTFKMVTASAAIEERAFSPDDLLDVSAGMIRIGGRVVEDTHRHGVLNFMDVIVQSSNVGAIKIGSRLGQERLGRYVRRFGFGTRICPDFLGESAGMLQPASSWSASSLASISMGYEIGVTPVQMASAFSTVANGGLRLQPHVVQALRQGTQCLAVERQELGRTVDAATAAELVTIMEQVVARGTGKAAQVPGYTVAGKTGTAARIVNRRYSKSDYYSSFVGFVPSRKPALTILVVVDTPRGPGYPGGHRYYGGAIAAPVFRRVAEQALRYLGVAPTVDPVPPVLVADSPFDTPNGTTTPAATTMLAGPAVDVETGAPVVPDLRGLGAREAVRRLTRLGLTAQITGDGVVLDQDPLPGEPVENRSTCMLRLGRVAAPSPVPPQ